MNSHEQKPNRNARRINATGKLIEQSDTIARNLHKKWVKLLEEQGWQHNTDYSYERKLHPNLIPYDELPENEKEISRNLTIETIKFISELGFSITPKLTHLDRLEMDFRQAKMFIETIKSRLLNGKRNLIYFASGNDLDDIRSYYSNRKFEDFDNIVLVDFHHHFNAIIDNEEGSAFFWNNPPSKFNNRFKEFNKIKRIDRSGKNLSKITGKIICLKVHAIEAINIFYENDVKFDYFTVINEGWVQYPALNNHGFIGYALPILKESFFYYTEDEYFKKCVKTLPYDNINKIEENNANYLEVYSIDQRIKSSLYHISQPRNAEMVKRINNVSVFLVNKSIWQDRKDIDWFIYALRHEREYEDAVWCKIKKHLNNVSFISRGPLDGVKNALIDAENAGAKVVGSTPLGLQEDYQGLLDFIGEQNFKNIEEIRLYHFKPNDYSAIKGQFEKVN